MAKVFIVSGTSWSGVATDGSNITVEAIGGGGGGTDRNDTKLFYGGGGGEYRTSSVAYTSNTTVNGIQIGAGGGDAAAGTATTWNTNVVIANGGLSNVATPSGGSGGTGTTGHNGGQGGTSTGNSGGGGGGAGGPNGVGGAGGSLTNVVAQVGAGGGGNGGGTAGQNISTSTTTGGNGGNGNGGTGGGTGTTGNGANGTAGTGGGGAGGGGGSTTTGGNGAAGSEFDSSHGSGGGGGGSTSGETGGAGGLYGGGGAGAGTSAGGVGGSGAQGIIVVSYTAPSGPAINVSDSTTTSESVTMDEENDPIVSDSTTTSENVKIMLDEDPSVSDSSTVVDKASYFSDLVLISDVPTATPTFPVGLNIDLNITADGIGVNSVHTHTFSTAYANEVLIALVNINTASGNDPVISGGGLTWVQVTKRDTQNAPNAYIYRAFSASPLTNVQIKATAPDASNYDIQITVLSFLGADQTGTNGSGAIGANTVGGNTGTTKPTLTVNTTRPGSLVVGVYGYNNNETLTADTGQTIYGQQQDNSKTISMASLGQNAVTPSSGTNVTTDLTNSSGWDWNGAVVEVLEALQVINLSVSDSTTTSENIAISMSADIISVFDSTTTSESVTMDLIDNINVSDSSTTSENIHMNEEDDPSVSDSSTTSENIAIQMSADIISDSDSTTTSESVTVIPTIGNISVNDATTTSENVKMELDNFTSVSDSTTTSENIHMNEEDDPVVNDSTTTSEAVTIDLIGQDIIFDSTTTSENVKMEIDDFISVSDSSTTSESVTPQITVDYVSVADVSLATDIRRNYVTNPSFEADTVGSNPPATYTAFTTVNTGTLTPQVASDSAQSGSQSWKINVTGGHADAGITSPRYSVNPGQYTVSYYMRTALSAGSAHLHVKVYSGANVTAEYDLTGANGTTGWTRYSMVIQLQPGDTAIELWLGFGTFGDTFATGTVWYDALQIEAGSLSSYFDGSYAGVNWDGSANASTSSTALQVVTVDVIDVDVIFDSTTTSEAITIMLSILESMPSISSGEHQGLRIWS